MALIDALKKFEKKVFQQQKVQVNLRQQKQIQQQKKQHLHQINIKLQRQHLLQKFLLP